MTLFITVSEVESYGFLILRQ